MMKSARLTLILMLTLISTLYTSNIFAQHGIDTFQLRTLGLSEYVHSFIFSPDGYTLASVGRVGNDEGGYSDEWVILLWDVATGTEKARFGPLGPVRDIVEFEDINFSPDSQTLAGSIMYRNDRYQFESAILLWDVATGTEKARLSGYKHNEIHGIMFSPDSQTLAVFIEDRSDNDRSKWGTVILLWDVATGTEKVRFGPFNALWSINFSPDGQTLAGSIGEINHRYAWEGHILLWDVATGTEKARFGFGSDKARGLNFSPDGQTLARVDGVNILLWDVATGTEKARFGFGSDEARGLNFSPDGQTLASYARSPIVEGQTAEVSGTVILWDVATGTKTATLHRRLSGLVFSPDGQTLAGKFDGNIVLWDLPATQVRITPFPAESPSIGAKLVINVAIAAGQNVGGYQVTIEFDGTALRYVESANGDYLPPGAFAAPPDISDSKVTLAATSLAGTAKGDGTLVTLTFEVVDIKESKLILSESILTDSSGELLPHRFFSGLVTDPQIAPEDVNSDGVVNILDLVKVASRFNQREDIEKEDINGDGIVNIVDLVKVAGALGGGAAAPSLAPQTLAMFTAADVQKWLSAAQQLNLTDATSQRGLLFLENLLAALTPKETGLLPNYPNPFNPETWIPYQLAEPADVNISIYAVDGKLIRTLVLGHRPIGIYQDKSRAAYWDGKNALGETVASGVYFYTLAAGDFSATRKMLILK